MENLLDTTNENKIIDGKAIMKLTYQHVITAGAEDDFDKQIHRNSYQEFLLKSQAYNPERKFRKFSELKVNDGRANSLHYKCGFAASRYIDLLNGRNPYLADNIGQALPFDDYRFELIESDIEEMQNHIIAIYFTSPFLILKQSFGEYLVLAKPGADETFTVRMQPGLSISSYEDV